MEIPHFLALASTINFRLERAAAMPRYSCFEGRYGGNAPVARQDNCDGTFYKDKPWCCSISCTWTGSYYDCSNAEMSCGNHMSEFYRGGDKHKQCVDIYVAAWNDPRTYGKNQLLVEEDSFGRACLDIKGTNKKVCVCYIQKSTNPGYLPCNTVGLFDQCPPNSGWWCQNGYGYGSRSYGRGYGDARAMNRPPFLGHLWSTAFLVNFVSKLNM